MTHAHTIEDHARDHAIDHVESVGDRDDVERLCALLAQRIVDNGSRPPTITKRWRDAARLLLDRDGRSLDEALWLVEWSQRDEFWRSNVLSMPKFREKYDVLRLQASRSNGRGPRDRAAEILERASSLSKASDTRTIASDPRRREGT